MEEDILSMIETLIDGINETSDKVADVRADLQKEEDDYDPNNENSEEIDNTDAIRALAAVSEELSKAVKILNNAKRLLND